MKFLIDRASFGPEVRKPCEEARKLTNGGYVMGYKAHDHQERRCMDCLFLKRRKTWNNSKRYYEYGWFCTCTNQEIHKIRNEDCWVLSDAYPYGKMEVK